MSIRRCLAFFLVVSIAAALAPGAEASRTASDSRGLPRLLTADESDLRLFPATVGTLSPQLVIESSWSSSDILHSDPAGNDEFALALAGRRVRFGYVLDGSSQNLVIGGPGGWGAILGFVDRYTRDEDYRYQDEDYLSRTDYEEWERALRFALGWRRVLTEGRLIEIGVAGSLIQGERDVETLVLRNGEAESHSLRWKADRGTGFETTLRTLSTRGGLQAAFRFRYDDLHPESNHNGFEPQAIRRGATLDVGWRFSVSTIDDFVAGVTASWWKEQELGFSRYASEPAQESEQIRYAGAIFLSAEEWVTDRLVIRGGVQGPANFSIDQERTYELDGEEYIVGDENRRSTGATLTPLVFLGAGWTWKDLTVEAQINRRVYLDNPLVRWSARVDF